MDIHTITGKNTLSIFITTVINFFVTLLCVVLCCLSHSNTLPIIIYNVILNSSKHQFNGSTADRLFILLFKNRTTHK